MYCRLFSPAELLGTHSLPSQLGAEQDQLLGGSTGILSGHWREGNSHGSGMSSVHTLTASSALPFRAPVVVGNAAVGRGNTGWPLSKKGGISHPEARV